MFLMFHLCFVFTVCYVSHIHRSLNFGAQFIRTSCCISSAQLRCLFINQEPNMLKFLQPRRFHSTIFSLSSGFGKCGVAVIRVSGPSTKQVLHQMTSIEGDPKPRFAYYKNIHKPRDRMQILDKGLVLWFPGESQIIYCLFKMSIFFQRPTASPARTAASSKCTADQRSSNPSSPH